MGRHEGWGYPVGQLHLSKMTINCLLTKWAGSRPRKLLKVESTDFPRNTGYTRGDTDTAKLRGEVRAFSLAPDRAAKLDERVPAASKFKRQMATAPRSQLLIVGVGFVSLCWRL